MGLAIAAKRVALARTGRDVPDLLVVDRRGVAANWTGDAGYTDGRQLLSTEPEKDVGFPYAHTWGADSERVGHEMGRWSWQSYLIHQEGFADWVDRGRPRPSHRQWSRYLGWVAARVPVEPILAAVDGIDLADGRWRLSARAPAGDRVHFGCDGLVLTGPGRPLRLRGQPDDHPRILDGRTFWTSEEALERGGPVEVCVIGNGRPPGRSPPCCSACSPRARPSSSSPTMACCTRVVRASPRTASTPTPPWAGSSSPSVTAASSSSAPTAACSPS